MSAATAHHRSWLWPGDRQQE